jgi:3-oxoacyl-[acyl-carrier-protein] synthase II
MRTRVVITGMGVVSPLGNGVEALWDGLTSARSAIRAITGWDTEAFPCKIAGIAEDVVPEGFGKKDLLRQSRFILFAIEAADQAWRQAGLSLDAENPHRCGTIIGSGIGSIEDIYESAIKLPEHGPRRIAPMMLPKGLSNMASGAVAIRLGLMGPNRAIVTACATGSQSIGDAADMIRLGKADVMLAGGSESTIIPFGIGAFAAIRALSTHFNDTPERASRPFDKERDGFVMGEGAGVLVLESEEHARARGAEILGEVAACGESCDAYHVTAPREDGSGAAAAMRAALDEAGLNPGDIDYFNAHGTSTPLNEPGEARALRSVFGEAMPPVSSTKSQMGHLLGAAGAVEAVVCLLAIQRGLFPANINFETPDPDCEVNLVANSPREGRIAIAMSNSLGFGGHNASLILRRYE